MKCALRGAFLVFWMQMEILFVRLIHLVEFLELIFPFFCPLLVSFSRIFLFDLELA
jgi:hypothetical protein